MSDRERVAKATAYITQKSAVRPKIGLILGSGLGILADEITDADKIAYENIPSFPISTVSGHAGQLVMGTLSGRQVVAMQGRFHQR